MSVNLYDLGARVPYGEFVTATSAFVLRLIEANGVKWYNPDAKHISTQPSPTDTASVECAWALDNKLSYVFINLPAIDPDTVVSGTFARQLLGLVMHETLHVLRSQVPQLTTALSNAGPGRGVVNALEDYFIEREGTRPGASITDAAPAILGALNADLQASSPDMAREAAAAGDQLAQAEALILASMNRHGQQGGALRDVEREVRSIVHPDVLAIVDNALDKLDATGDRDKTPFGQRQGQQGRIALYMDVLKQLKAMPPQQAQQQPQQGQGQPQKQGQGGEGDKPKDEAGNGGEGKSEAGEAESNSSGKDGKQSNAEGGKGASTGKPGAVKPKPADQRAKAMLRTAAPKQTSQQRAKAQSMMIALTADPSEPAGDANDLKRGNTPASVRTAAARANARTFADAARRALRAEDTTTSARRLQTGRMDRRAIARASMGALDVMTRKTTDQGIRTAVVVMVDLSSSMSDACNVGGAAMSRMEAVAGAASVIVPAIERAGAEVAVIGFTTSTNQKSGVVSLKPWTKRLPTTEEALKPAALGGLLCSGGTPMIRPARYAEAQLRARRVNRRVCIWLCDGQPSDSEVEGLKAMFKGDKGIEHVGIGLDCSLGRLFPRARHVAVSDMSKLASAFEQLLIPKPGARR